MPSPGRLTAYAREFAVPSPDHHSSALVTSPIPISKSCYSSQQASRSCLLMLKDDDGGTVALQKILFGSPVRRPP